MCTMVFLLIITILQVCKTERFKLAQTIQKEILKDDEWKNMGEQSEEFSSFKT